MELEVLKMARGFVAQGWCKVLAETKGKRVWMPQGEWVLSDPKNPNSDLKFQDAEAWSMTGAILRAELLVRGGKLGDHYPLYKTDAHKFVLEAVKERGFYSLADFNDPDRARGSHKQQDMLDVMDRAIVLAENFYACN